MTSQGKALTVIVVTALGVGAAGLVKWRSERFLDLAERITPCETEAAVLHRTAPLGPPRRDEHHGDWRELAWVQGGKVLSVVLVRRPSTGQLVVGLVSVEPERRTGVVLTETVYEDRSGLRQCK